jgi:ABC-type sugar transport system substrate-binding protein
VTTQAGIVAVALAAALATGGASGASGASIPFSPKAMAGTWNGTWKNTRFGSTGPAKIVAKSLGGGKKLVFRADLGGNVFGCTDPPAEQAVH